MQGKLSLYAKKDDQSCWLGRLLYMIWREEDTEYEKNISA